MSDFQQVIKWLKEGKKVRRKSHDPKSYFIVYCGSEGQFENCEGTYRTFDMSDFEATDWEIYEEKIKIERRSFSESVAYIKAKFDVGEIDEVTYRLHIAAIMEYFKC